MGGQVGSDKGTYTLVLFIYMYFVSIPDGLEHPVLCPGVLHLVLRQDKVLLQDLHGVEALQKFS